MIEISSSAGKQTDENLGDLTPTEALCIFLAQCRRALAKATFPAQHQEHSGGGNCWSQLDGLLAVHIPVHTGLAFPDA